MRSYQIIIDSIAQLFQCCKGSASRHRKQSQSNLICLKRSCVEKTIAPCTKVVQQKMAVKKEESHNDGIKRRDESGVNGYIREIEKNSFSNHAFYKEIPKIINDLCCEYYHESKDRFHPKLHGTKLKMQTVQAIHDNSFGTNSAFLSNIVSKGIHKWRFRQIGQPATFIGIIDNSIDFTKYFLYESYYWELPSSSFGVLLEEGWLHGGDKGLYHKRQYCPLTRNNDIIEMCLDFHNMELKFIINEKDYGKAFDIAAGEYRAGVCLSWNSTGFELLQYDAK